jgi:hypothetical protein
MQAATVVGTGGCNATAPYFNNGNPNCQLDDWPCGYTRSPTSEYTCNNDWIQPGGTAPGGRYDCGNQANQYLCSALDISNFQNLPDGGPVAGGSPAAINWYQVNGATNGLVQIEYYMDDILYTAKNLQTWLTWFGTLSGGFWQPSVTDGDISGNINNGLPNPTTWSYNTLMYTYCQNTTSDCKPNVAGPRCSLVFASGQTGPCSAWMTTLLQGGTATAGQLTNFINAYCGNAANTGNSDCDCYNAPSNPLFQQLQEAAGYGQAGCFWTPCQTPSFFLVPPADNPPSSGCADICENVIIYVDGHPNINQSEINQYVNCPGMSGGGGGGGLGPGAPSSTPWALIIGLVAAAVLVAAIFLGIILT